MAPSKTFNVPGLGCSFAIIPDGSVRKKFIHAGDGIVPHVNMLGYTACRAAFNDSRDWHGQMLEYLSENRRLVYETINSIEGMWVDKSGATYLAWINIEGLNIERPVEFFEKAGVGIDDGASFAGQGFIRMNFGCPRARLIEALDRIKKAVKSR
jgi:cystathionine beta-lyase